MDFLKKKTKRKSEEEALNELLNSTASHNALTDLENNRNRYRLIIACLSLTTMLLAMMAFSKKTEVIVMPPDYWEPVSVNGKYANTAYAAGHAVAVANMMGNVNERNIDFVTSYVTRMLSPYLQVQLTQAFQTETALLKKRRARQSFYVEDVMFDAVSNIVFVWGTKRTSTVSSPEVTQRYTYEFRIEPHNGAPKITHYDSYSGIPKPRDPSRKADIKPYLTKELMLAQVMASDNVTYETSTDTPSKTDNETKAAPPEAGQATQPVQEGDKP